MSEVSARRGRAALFAWVVAMLGTWWFSSKTATGFFLTGIAALWVQQSLPRSRQLLRQATEECRAAAALLRRVSRAAPAAVRQPAWLQLLWRVAWYVLFVAGCGSAFFAASGPWQIVFGVSVSSFGLVASLDLVVFGRALVRWGASRKIGVVVLAAMAALMAGLSLSLARKTLFDLTGQDPGSFPAALTALTGLLAPITWLFATALLGALLMVPLFVLSMARGGWLARRHRPWSDDLQDFIQIARPLFICAVPMVLAGEVAHVDLRQDSILRKAGLVVVVSLDFWQRPVCGGATALAARIDDQHFVVFDPSTRPWAIRPVSCAPATLASAEAAPPRHAGSRE